ncbi:glycosyltransferase family 4 protein [Candidatus Falkowbacteria bacterium]|nr:glycosyltransferase family 4 protein [Candidatus Falkowbacteria bacterium]
MRILLFTLEYPPFYGGVANYYGNLIKNWPKPNDISALNNNGGDLINDKLPFLKWLPAYFSLRKKIKQEKIEHILVGQILPLGTVALICAKLCKIKYSAVLHGLDLSSALKRPRKKWLAGKILKKADKIICVNGYVAELARNSFPDIKQKIIIVNPGIENSTTRTGRLANQIRDIRDKYNLENKLILLSVGRFVKRKGFDKVIECLPEALKQAPNLIYVIIGQGEEIDNFKFRIKNLGLEKNIIIITGAANEEKNAWYNLCDIFIMPSRNINGDFEGFGIVYLEANLAGKPVIAGKSGGVGDAVLDGLHGLLVNSEVTG